jgi:hypothetical protein
MPGKWIITASLGAGQVSSQRTIDVIYGVARGDQLAGVVS